MNLLCPSSALSWSSSSACFSLTWGRSILLSTTTWRDESQYPDKHYPNAPPPKITRTFHRTSPPIRTRVVCDYIDCLLTSQDSASQRSSVRAVSIIALVLLSHRAPHGLYDKKAVSSTKPLVASVSPDAALSYGCTTDDMLSSQTRHVASLFLKWKVRLDLGVLYP